MSKLSLAIRTPLGLVVDQAILALTAEDLDGWFGIFPGRADVLAVLPPGLLVFRDSEGESFVAVGGGLLHLAANRCRVAARDAIVSRKLDDVADALATHLARRKMTGAAIRSVMDDLAREALKRLVRSAA